MARLRLRTIPGARLSHRERLYSGDDEEALPFHLHRRALAWRRYDRTGRFIVLAFRRGAFPEHEQIRGLHRPPGPRTTAALARSEVDAQAKADTRDDSAAQDRRDRRQVFPQQVRRGCLAGVSIRL